MKKIILFSCLAFIYMSCEHDPMVVPADQVEDPIGIGNPPIDLVSGVPCDPDSVYFTNDILPIFISSCAIAKCHDATTHRDGLVLDNYSRIIRGIKPGNPSESKYYKVLVKTETDDLMPQDPQTGRGYRLPAEQLSLIKTWIEQGAKDNFCSSCDTTNVSFIDMIKPLFTTSCATSSGCHGNGSSNGTLVSYDQIKAMADNGSIMNRVVVRQDMPPGGGLTSCDVNSIRIWLENGAPNN